MRAEFRIEADGQNVTDAIASRFRQLTLVDGRGIGSDTLEIVLDDRPHQATGGYIELPKKGVMLKLALGYDGQLATMGKFVVDEANPSGPPEIITISAHAADMRYGMKQRRTRQFENTTLAEIIATLAATHDLIPKVGESFASIPVARIDQADESDLHLMSRIARDYGAVVKPAFGYLIMVQKGQAKAVSGTILEPVTLHKSDLISWRATLADRDKYSSVKARYRDIDAGSDSDVTAGSGEPVYRIRRSFPDLQSAGRAADAKLAALARGTGQLSAETSGHAQLVAEGVVHLSGMRPGLNGAWAIDSATHTLTKDGGWKVRLEMEIKS